MRSGARFMARLLRRGANVFDSLGQTQKWVMQHPRRDMVVDVDEQHYSQQYWHWLQPIVESLPSGARVLDAGCGYGRLAIAVAAARPDCTIVGVDLAPPAIQGALRHAADNGLRNCTFVEADLSAYLPSQPPQSVDLLLWVEVSFFAAQDLRVLPQANRLLRGNGVVYAGFRSQWFNLVHSVVAHDLESAAMVATARDGRLWGSGHRSWWHTPEHIRRAFAEAGLSLDQPCRGIGELSALKLDGTGLPQPSSFSDASALSQLELALAEPYAAQGRYIVAVGRKASQ